MSTSLSGFEDFLEKFRKLSRDPQLDYWADAIFVMRWRNDPLVESRFKGGVWLWLAWVSLKLLSRPRAPAPRILGLPLQDGFRLLTTPAHRDSLTPLIARLDSNRVRIFSEGPEFQNRPQTTLGFTCSIALLGWGDRFKALFRTIGIYRRIVKILDRCLPDEPRLPDGFHPRLIEQILVAELALARLRRSEPPLRSLFITYELPADSKALVRWARETAADVIHVMHGQRLPTYQVTMATDLVLLSKIDEPWFRARVDPSVRIRAAGHPRLENLRQSVPAPQPRKGRTRPRIAFFSQPLEGDYTPDRRDADWYILTSLRGKADVRFRLHPRESKKTALLALQRCGLEFVELSDLGLQDDLVWCDGIASSWSTVSLEAAACGRGIFWTCAAPELYEASQELRNHGIGVLIPHADHWFPYLDAWSGDGWPAPVTVAGDRLLDLGIIGDMTKSSKGSLATKI